MKSRMLTSNPPFDPAEAEIQKRAYLLWLEKGCPSGKDLELWLAAKELLKHQTTVAPPRRRNSPKSASVPPVAAVT